MNDYEKRKKKTRSSFSALERKELEKLKNLELKQKKDGESLNIHFGGWLHPNPALTDKEFFEKLTKFRKLRYSIDKSKARIEEYRDKQVIVK